jgi:hypothetical protein
MQVVDPLPGQPFKAVGIFHRPDRPAFAADGFHFAGQIAERDPRALGRAGFLPKYRFGLLTPEYAACFFLHTSFFGGGRTVKHFALAAVLASAMSAPVAEAAVVLTTDGSAYTGPVLDFTGYTGLYTFFNAPITLADGTVVTPFGTSGQGGSVIGIGGYGLGSNGTSFTTPLIGTNWLDGYLEFTFASALSSFGGGWDYFVPQVGSNPFIDVLDTLGNVLASFDLTVDAPINAPGNEAFQFIGFQSDSADIGGIRFGGSYIVYTAPSVAAVPVPASLALLLTALAAFGVAANMRRRPSAD